VGDGVREAPKAMEGLDWPGQSGGAGCGLRVIVIVMDFAKVGK
jgi:hypothetical protein